MSFAKIKVIFMNFPVSYFLAGNSGKGYFIKHSQQINVTGYHNTTL